MQLSILVLALLSQTTFAFIPPVGAMVRDVFQGRKSAMLSEVVMRHRVELSGGTQVDIDEQWMGDPGRGISLYRSGGSVVGFSTYEKRAFFYSGSKYISRNGLQVRYLLSGSPDDFIGILLQEQYLKREQLQQFNPEFNPTGEPQTWGVKEQILKHDGIYMKRFRQNPCFVVSVGDGATRALYIDNKLNGIRHFEWSDGGEKLGVNFDEFLSFQSPGTFPRFISLERGGKEVVRSEVLSHKQVKEKQLGELRALTRNTSQTNSSYDEAIKLLLSFR